MKQIMMFNIFQILFLVFAVFAIYSVFARRKKHQLSGRGSAFWILFWIVAAAVVLIPNSTTIVAHMFGIGRGVDFIFYISFAFIFFILFRLHVKLESMNRDITKIVRKNALDNHNADRDTL